MQAGVTGARVSAVQRPVVTIDTAQISDMESEAARYHLHMGEHPELPQRMTLGEAFEALRANQLDPNDPESPIRFPRPTEIAHAVDEMPELAGRSLIVLDDRIHPAVVLDVSSLGSGAQQPGGDLYLDLPPVKPGRVFVHEVGPDFDPRSVEQEPPMQRGGYDMPMDREPPMARGYGGPEDERGPMPRGGRGEPMMEPRMMPRDGYDPAYDGPRQDLGFDRVAMRGGPQDDRRVERFDSRGAPQDDRRVERFDPRGAPQPMAAQGGDDIKVGRVKLGADDINEVLDICAKLRLDPGLAFQSMRAPTSAERLIARRELKGMRDNEARERLITIDPMPGKAPPILVSFTQKPTVTNFWSAAMFGTGLLMPGMGPAVQGALGFGTALAGLGGMVFGKGKAEHYLDLMRTGVKHAIFGTVGAIADFMTLGATAVPRMIAGVGLGAWDIVQGVRARKKPVGVEFHVVEKQPSLKDKAFGGFDIVANGIATALKR